MDKIFKDRTDAGRQLAKLLTKYKNTNGIVLALPRGGVPIGNIIAKELKLPLDLILSKKIGHPANPEYAIGAVSMKDAYINPDVHVSQEYINGEIQKIREQLQFRYKHYMKKNEPPNLKGKIVIIVDDGLATGNTMLSAVESAREEGPEKIVVAVPVAPAAAPMKFEGLADEFVCVLPAANLYAVGQFYNDFEQVTDEEVIEMMHQKISNQQA